MSRPLRLLLIDDSREDADAVVRAMEAGGYAVTCGHADREDSLRAALRSRWDVVVSERSVGALGGDTIRRMVERHDPSVPFLFLCRSLEPGWAVDAMRSGARYCLPKQRLASLPAVVGREVDEASRQRRRMSETQVQCMEAIGRVTGVIAHDFNNLLTVIRGYTGLLLDTLPPDNPARPDLASMDKAAAAAEALIQRLLWLGRRQPCSPEVLDLNHRLRESEQALRQRLGDGVTLTLELSGRLWPVAMDPSYFDQAVMQLADNAREAMPDGGGVVVTTENLPADDATPDDRVKVTVRDTGPGMDEATRRLAFEPFFTTRDRVRGAGLGLAIVYGMVTQAGGTIGVESEPGAGASFEILLPRHGAA